MLFSTDLLGWISEIRGNILNLLQKEGGTQKGWGSSLRNRKGASNPGGNYDVYINVYVCI